MYTLKIRIGQEYFPVNWEDGRLASGPLRATVFDEEGRYEALMELKEAGLRPEDYRFEGIESSNIVSNIFDYINRRL